MQATGLQRGFIMCFQVPEQGIFMLHVCCLKPSAPATISWPACRTGDCARATEAGSSCASCLCNTTLPYLHCHAIATTEIVSDLETAAKNPIAVDPGAGGWLAVHGGGNPAVDSAAGSAWAGLVTLLGY
jgi:hypothetical protein